MQKMLFKHMNSRTLRMNDMQNTPLTRQQIIQKHAERHNESNFHPLMQFIKTIFSVLFDFSNDNLSKTECTVTVKHKASLYH